MIHLNDPVFILPAASLLFKGRWGKVKEIQGGIFKVKLEGHNILFNFTRNELLNKEGFISWFKDVKTIKHIETGERLTKFSIDHTVVITPRHQVYSLYEFYPVTFCNRCGRETTGEFSALCEDCQYPLPKELL